MVRNVLISISIVFVITFSLLIISEGVIGDNIVREFDKQKIAEENFFKNKNFKENTVFLVGSSHVGRINATVVNQHVQEKTNEIDGTIIVYNLAKSGNNPARELQSVDLVISANPKIVIYGISYRDFLFPYDDKIIKDSILPDPELFVNYIKSSIPIGWIPTNPQLLTRNVLNDFFNITSELEQNNSKKTKTIAHTPFYKYSQISHIMTNEELKKEVFDPSNWKDSSREHTNYNALQKYIQKLQKNNIEIIIFTTPLQKYYLNNLSESQKNNFSTLLEKLSNNGIKIYELEEKYKNLNIWDNPTHVSLHSNATIFSTEIAEIIVQEINK
jgi:hypothetical protein